MSQVNLLYDIDNVCKKFYDNITKSNVIYNVFLRNSMVNELCITHANNIFDKISSYLILKNLKPSHIWISSSLFTRTLHTGGGDPVVLVY